ncbi:MAG: hypothetical protein ACKOXM_02285, partial [Agromyces sp.]
NGQFGLGTQSATQTSPIVSGFAVGTGGIAASADTLCVITGPTGTNPGVMQCAGSILGRLAADGVNWEHTSTPMIVSPYAYFYSVYYMLGTSGVTRSTGWQRGVISKPTGP